MGEPRYAVYYVPGASTALYRLGSAIIGFDSYTGRRLPHLPQLEAAFSALGAVTETPRIYGFHATIVAPFRLAAGLQESHLFEGMTKFARTIQAVPSFPLRVAKLGSFVALVPDSQRQEVNRLAVQSVEYFSSFRAQLTSQERERRLASRLSDRQIRYLDVWGYPYVFEEFRLHLSLTGTIAEKDKIEMCRAALEAVFREDGASAEIDLLSLLRQESAGAPFRVVHQVELAQSA
jgi:hypothetical protein